MTCIQIRKNISPRWNERRGKLKTTPPLPKEKEETQRENTEGIAPLRKQTDPKQRH